MKSRVIVKSYVAVKSPVVVKKPRCRDLQRIEALSEGGPQGSRRSWPRRMLNRLEVDQAVFFAIAARGWQFVAGPVTIVLIGTYFSGEVQGYYYTFWSLIALQTVFDFSFQQVIVNFASHEWGRLSGGSLAGKPGDEVAAGQAVGRAVGKDGGGSPGDSRLASLLRGSLGWYAIAAAAFFVVVGPAGIWFLGSGASSERITWKPGWWALVALTAVNFWTTPFLAVLEGCGRVRSIYQLQFARSFVGNWVVWLMIPLGAGLWVPAGAAAVRLLCEAIWIAGFHRRFFWRFLRRPVGEGVDWFGEIWPFQWRVGVRGLLGMLNTLLINPVVFYYQGEVAAGRFGMTWQVLTSLQAACMSWIKTRTAQFGMLVGNRDYAELDRIYFRLLKISLAFVTLGASGRVRRLGRVDGSGGRSVRRSVASHLAFRDVGSRDGVADFPGKPMDLYPCAQAFAASAASDFRRRRERVARVGVGSDVRKRWGRRGVSGDDRVVLFSAVDGGVVALPCRLASGRFARKL